MAELKDRIDGYFEQISADELYELLVNKYKFPKKRGRISDLGKNLRKFLIR